MFVTRHWFLFLLIFFLAVSILTWSARTQLAEIMIASAMSDAGLTDITADIHQLDINQSRIPQLNFKLSAGTALLAIEAHSIDLSYLPEKIVNGHIEKLSIGTLTVNYQQTAEKSQNLTAASNAIDPVRFIEILKQSLAKYIFFDELGIDNFTLNSTPHSILNGKSLRLSCTRQGDSLAAEVSLLDQHSAEKLTELPQITISHLSENRLKAEFRLADPSSTKPGTVVTNVDLAVKNTEVNGRYLIRPQKLLSWLQPWLSGIEHSLDQKSINQTAEINGTVLADFAQEQQVTATISALSDKLRYNEYSADNAIIKLKFRTYTARPWHRIQLLNGSYIKAGAYNYGHHSFTASTLFLIGELVDATGNWLYKGGMRSDLFASSYQSQQFQIRNINARMLADSVKLSISGDFMPVAIDGKFTFALNQALTGEHTGKLTIKSIEPLDLSAEDSRMSLLLTRWPYPFDLLAGDINLSSYAEWSRQNELMLKASLNFSDAGGYYNEIVFSGLSFEHELEILPTLHTIHSSTVKLGQIDSGITASNITARFKLDTAVTGPLPRLAIKGLHGEILGGAFSAPDFIYDANSRQNHLQINATGIDLAEIIKTQQFKDLSMTGSVSGHIPVEINKNGIRIEHGAFMNDIDRGTIRYNPGESTDQLAKNPLTGIALDALRDFRYSYLSAGVNYTEDGNLAVNLKLKGTSPELDTKRPVHLNINTEQNLLSLLKSLRYARGLSENIDNKVRHIYERKQE